MKNKYCVKVGNHYFKYDNDRAIVRMMYKPDRKTLAEMQNDNKEWRGKYGRDLWDIDEDGMTEIDSAGLSRENWNDPAARTEYLEYWNDDIEEEAARAASDFLKYEFRG